jgi:Uncharacterized protein conserved in bacteria
MPQPPKSRKREPKGFQIRQGGSEGESVENSGPAKPRRSFEDLGDLPHGYGSDTIFLVAQEPHRLFTYWDIDISRHPGGAAFLRVLAGDDGTLESQIEVPFEVRNWYIPVSRAGSEYLVEIGYFRGEDWNLVARSTPVTTPPEGISPSDDFDFATVPFHLSFQRLVERVEAAARSGEDLLAAVARMQRGGDFSAFGPAAAVLPGDPRALLAGLLGPDFLDELASGGLSSTEIEAAIRERVEEFLSSSGGSSELAGSLAAAAFASQFGEASFSSEAFASWAVSELTGPLASWSGESSWSASLGIHGESSWFLGGSWLQAASGSWESGAMSSWTSGAVSSWLQAGQTSWAQAALSSWGSSEYSSWFAAAAAESSWSGGSESISSFGSERGFFMHVNAEVIFYGGTDPKARVTINGVPVPLDAQGNFRYHFVFPNADYEMPIVAESPDGLETRSATLRFHRATGRVGLVTDTPQPPLGEPMGRLSI